MILSSAGETKLFLRIFQGLIFCVLFSACATKPPEPDNFISSFSQGPCLFGKIKTRETEIDPSVPKEIPHSGYLPATKCRSPNAESPLSIYSLPYDWINYEWTTLYFDGKSRFVALLDWSIEGGFEEIPLMESLDAGAHWSLLAKIKKPDFSARPATLTFDEKGRGEIVLEWETTDIRLFKLSTRDNGKSWSPTQP